MESLEFEYVPFVDISNLETGGLPDEISKDLEM